VSLVHFDGAEGAFPRKNKSECWSALKKICQKFGEFEMKLKITDKACEKLCKWKNKYLKGQLCIWKVNLSEFTGKVVVELANSRVVDSSPNCHI
jgi:hypothetical protein